MESWLTEASKQKEITDHRKQMWFEGRVKRSEIAVERVEKNN